MLHDWDFAINAYLLKEFVKIIFSHTFTLYVTFFFSQQNVLMEVEFTPKAVTKFMNAELGLKSEDKLQKVADRFHRKSENVFKTSCVVVVGYTLGL